MDTTIIICKKCGEMEDRQTRTGASIDGKYYCQGCYDIILDDGLNDLIDEVLNKNETS